MPLASAAPAILDELARIKAIADRHGVSMKAAGLQFPLANPAVAAVIPGASQPSRLPEIIPRAFSQDVSHAGLVDPG
ncbi:aldo/keto reductase [Sphingomonas faeni]|uniref:aldo/keto reductase n=1 Tax=Sphingomonas faeni TaxID=185950 RepID=UPI002FE4170C